MTHSVQVKCSRCNNIVEGIRGDGFTAGFYDVAKGYWKPFARREEKRLCDNCMHGSPEYQHVFGLLPGFEDKRDTPRGRLVARKLQILAATSPAEFDAALQGKPLKIFGSK